MTVLSLFFAAEQRLKYLNIFYHIDYLSWKLYIIVLSYIKKVLLYDRTLRLSIKLINAKLNCSSDPQFEPKLPLFLHHARTCKMLMHLSP